MFQFIFQVWISNELFSYRTEIKESSKIEVFNHDFRTFWVFFLSFAQGFVQEFIETLSMYVCMHFFCKIRESLPSLIECLII